MEAEEAGKIFGVAKKIFTDLYTSMSGVKLDRFLNSQKLAASIFILTGANKTYNDYKNADEKYKNKFLIKDSAILAGAAAGMVLQKKVSPKVSQIKPLQEFVEKISQKLAEKNFSTKIKKPVNYAREIILDTLKNVSMFASGILGALGVDLILSRIKVLNPKVTFDVDDDSNNLLDSELDSMQHFIDKGVDKVILDKEVKNAMYERITDMPQLGILTGSLAGANALDLAKETEFKTKLEHTGSCIINNSMLPMLYLAIANVATKNLTPSKRVPAIFGILVAGTILTSKLTEMKMKFLSEKNFKNYMNKLNFLKKMTDKQHFYIPNVFDIKE